MNEGMERTIDQEVLCRLKLSEPLLPAPSHSLKEVVQEELVANLVREDCTQLS